MAFHRETASEVGRFWYRRPTGESGADVYDRASSFWDDVLTGLGTPNPMEAYEVPETRKGWVGKSDDALLVVTHGLTMRLLVASRRSNPRSRELSNSRGCLSPAGARPAPMQLMRYFQWSPQTFDAVYNP